MPSSSTTTVASVLEFTRTHLSPPGWSQFWDEEAAARLRARRRRMRPMRSMRSMLGGLWALELGKAAELDKLHRYFVNEWPSCFLLDRRLVRRCKGVFLSGDGADHRVAVIAISKLGGSHQTASCGA